MTNALTNALTLRPGLSLTRCRHERIVLTTAAGETIELTVLAITRREVKLHFAAPANVTIFRSELVGTPQPEPTAA